MGKDDDDDDCFYIALFPALEQPHCAFVTYNSKQVTIASPQDLTSSSFYLHLFSLTVCFVVCKIHGCNFPVFNVRAVLIPSYFSSRTAYIFSKLYV